MGGAVSKIRDKYRRGARTHPKYKPSKTVVVKEASKKRRGPTPEAELAEAELKLRVRPKDRRALMTAARLRFFFGDHAGAADAAEKCIAQGVDEVPVHLVIMRAHAACWRALRRASRRPGPLERKELEHHLRRARAGALAVLAVPLCSRRPSLILEAAGVELRLGNVQRAADLANFAVGMYPGDAVAFDGEYALCHVALAGKRPADALALRRSQKPRFPFLATWATAEPGAVVLLPAMPLAAYDKVERFALEWAAGGGDGFGFAAYELHSYLADPRVEGVDDRFGADAAPYEDWLASPHPCVAMAGRYRDALSFAMAVAFLDRAAAAGARALAGGGDGVVDLSLQTVVDECHLHKAECLEELRDFVGAFAAVGAALRGRDAKALPGAADLLGRVAPRVLGPRSEASIAYKRVATLDARAARLVQRRWRGHRARRRTEAATTVASLYRARRDYRRMREWLRIATGARADEGLVAGTVVDEAAKERKQRFMAELEDMSDNQRERALARRKHELDAIFVPEPSDEEKALESAAQRDRAVAKALRTLQGRHRGDAARAALRARVAHAPGFAVVLDVAAADAGASPLRYAPARSRNPPPLGSARPASVSTLAASAARPGAPVAAARDDVLAALVDADTLVVRRALFSSSDALRLARVLEAARAPRPEATPRSARRLKALEFDCPRLGGLGLEALADACGRLPALASLRVERGDAALDARGLRALAGLLETNGNLARLEACGDRRDGKVAAPQPLPLDAAFARAVGAARNLVALRVAHARLGDAAAEVLGGGVAGNASLKELHVEGNELSRLGAKHLVRLVVLGRPVPLWTLGLARQRPRLERCDVRDVCRDVDDAREGAARLEYGGPGQLGDAGYGSYGFRPPDLRDDAPGAALLPPMDVAVGDRVEVRWLQQRAKGQRSRYRSADVVSLDRSHARVRYEHQGGFVESVSRYLLRKPGGAAAAGPPSASGPRKTVEFVARDGQTVKMAVRDIAETLAAAHDELRLLDLNEAGAAAAFHRGGHKGGPPKTPEPLFARTTPLGTSRPMTREQMRDVVADQYDELRLFGFAPPKTPLPAPPPDDDAAAALPADHVRLLVAHAPRPLPTPPLDLVSDLDYVKFAEDDRRNKRTVVLF